MRVEIGSTEWAMFQAKKGIKVYRDGKFSRASLTYENGFFCITQEYPFSALKIDTSMTVNSSYRGKEVFSFCFEDCDDWKLYEE